MSWSASTAVSDPGPAAAPIPLGGADQRNRLLAATIATVAERGYGATTVAQIAAEAGISPADFSLHFKDKEASYLAAYEVAVEWLETEIREAVGRDGGWPQGVRTAVEATLSLVAADPHLARFCASEPLFAGAAALERHRATVRRLAESLRAGREHCAWGAELPDELEETIVGGAVWSVALRARPGGAQHLLELAPELTYFLLTPYFDTAEARRLAGE